MIPDQYRKVLPSANIDFRICRGDSRFQGIEFEPFPGETLPSTESLVGNNGKGESNSQGTKQTNQEVIILSNSSSSSNHRHLPHQRIHKLICVYLFDEKMAISVEARRRTFMVKRKFDPTQQEIFTFLLTSNNNKLRCIITRLRSKLPRPEGVFDLWRNENPT